MRRGVVLVSSWDSRRLVYRYAGGDSVGEMGEVGEVGNRLPASSGRRLQDGCRSS